jgi:hypothetical protein
MGAGAFERNAFRSRVLAAVDRSGGDWRKKIPTKVIIKNFLFLALFCSVALAQSMDSGTGAPSNSVGSNGDLYHRTDTGWIYGPKASGAWPSTYSVILGRGCTTAYHIDWYCTGLGVGGVDPNATQMGGVDPNPLFGFDAGLTGPTPDGTVHTTAQVFAKYSTIDAFFAAVGYTPSRWWAISPTGNDSTCVAGTSAQALASPCATFTHISPEYGTQLIQPGDAVVWRAGSYSQGGMYTISGTSSAPILIINYPGEYVRIDGGSSGGFSTLGNSYITFDGFEITDSGSNYAGLGYGFYSGSQTNITIRNVWAHDFADNIIAGDGIANYLLERNVWNNGGEGDGHDVYLGARSDPASNITLQDSILYNGSSTPFQFNGRVTNLQFLRNIVHSGDGTGIGLLNGVSNSTIANNVSFNHNGAAMELFVYNNGSCPSICPYPETGNTIQNNSFWVGTTNTTCAVILVNDNGAGNSLGSNLYANNAIETGNTLPPICPLSGTVSTDISTDTFDNNVLTGDGTMVVAGLDGSAVGSYACTTLASFATVSSCINSDPMFVNVSDSLIATPWLFDFHLSSGSPAIGAGTATGDPPNDIQGNTPPNPPSIGAYQSSSSASSTTSTSTTTSSYSACDLLQQGSVDAADVQAAINQALGISPCTNADLQGNGTCTVVDVQRVINAALGGSCLLGP